MQSDAFPVLLVLFSVFALEIALLYSLAHAWDTVLSAHSQPLVNTRHLNCNELGGTKP